jgi:subtilisin family serine protease
MRTILQLAIVCFSLTRCLSAQQRFIVRTSLGAAALQTSCAILGCTVLGGVGDPAGQVFVITTVNVLNASTILTSLQATAGVTHTELDQIARVADNVRLVPDSLYRSDPVTWFGMTTRYGYVFQPAAQIVRLIEAQSSFGVTGAGIVAVIDTGVDPEHPILRATLVPGYDFTRNMEGFAPESSDVTQSTAAVVDGSPAFFVNDNVSALLDSTTAGLLRQNHSAFGHGTMVAGIVHLVAPRAQIMPLKAFGSDGTGYTSDILRATYYAVRRGARVVNMSFSMPLPSAELKRAIDYAAGSRTICVAAAGNEGLSSPRYPAGYSNVIAVASTTDVDTRSSFSNYGSNWIWLAAPGEGIVTTYPYATFAAGWGTSFSVPFVAGTVALLLETRSTVTVQDATLAVGQARPVSPELGRGRLDVFRAVQSVKSYQ